MTIFFVVYLSMGILVTLLHSRVRATIFEVWYIKVDGIEKAFVPLAWLAAFVFAVICWPRILWVAESEKRQPDDPLERLRRDPRFRKRNPLGYALLEMSAQGTDADEIPGGVGEFGLVETNPIPTCNILGSQSYLRWLVTDDGRRVCHERRGSTIPHGFSNPVDIYDLTDTEGRSLGMIYISPYNRRNSARAPKGFKSTGPEAM